MRGSDAAAGSLFSCVDLEDRIPARHPLRKVRSVVNDALRSLDAEFDRLYAGEGRASIAPIRSERQFMAQMDCNLLFRWFVGVDHADRPHAS